MLFCLDYNILNEKERAGMVVAHVTLSVQMYILLNKY